MLNRNYSQTESFATEPVSTVTVSPVLREDAANDAVNAPGNVKTIQSRRMRRQATMAASPVGGWKVRMW